MSRLGPQLVCSAAVAALGGFLFGFDTAVISGHHRRPAAAVPPRQQPARIHRGQRADRHHLRLDRRGQALRALRAGGRCCARWRCFTSSPRSGCGLAWNWLSLSCFRFVGGLAIGGVLGRRTDVHRGDRSAGACAGGWWRSASSTSWPASWPPYLSNYLIAGAIGGPETDAWRVDARRPAVPVGAVLRPGPRHPGEPALAGRRRTAGDEAARGAASDRQRRPGSARAAEIAESLHEETVSADEPFFQRKYRKPILLAVMVAIVQPAIGHQRAHLLHRRHLQDGRGGAHGRPAAVGRSSASRTSSSRCWP